MIKTLPDKYIRKAVFNAFNGTIVDGQTINVYDTRYTSKSSTNDAYVLMTVQSNEVDYNKCDNFWVSNILLEVCTVYAGNANTGSRLLADNILESLRNSLTTYLDLTGSDLEVVTQLMFFPNDLATVFPNSTLFRKFLRLELKII